MTTIDVAQVRADTPGCEGVVHLNNAGCALPPKVVLDANLDYLRLEATIGGYEAESARTPALDRFYPAAAILVGADASEIALTRGASESWWRAFLAVPLQPGDRVLAGRHEFVSGALGLLQARKRGIDVEFVPDAPDGTIDLDAMAAMLDERVKLVCLTSFPMTNGLVNPAAEVGALAKSVGAYYLLDACQALGQAPVDVDHVQCDFLTGTSRKWLRGLRGTGLLYVRASVLDELNEPVFSDGRAADWFTDDDYRFEASALRFELGEISYAGKLGLATAIEYALDLGIDAIAARVGELGGYARSQLDEIGGVRVNDVGTHRSGIVTFTVEGVEPGDVTARLREIGINTAAPMARTSRLDLERAGLERVVRASPHYYNTEAEIDRLSEAVAGIASG